MKVIKRLLNLILLGIGLGVIAGSILKSISISKMTTISNRRNNYIDKIFKDEIPDDFTEDQANRKSFLLAKKKNNNYIEIKSLSNQWKDLNSRQKGIKASGFLLMIDKKLFAQLTPDVKMSAASSIKIPILLMTLKNIDSGLISWDEKLTLTKEVIGGGAGWMSYQPLGTKFPIYEIATEMIRISDNTATNLLIKKLGGIDKINKYFKYLGLDSTYINNLLPDLNGTNKTSAKDLSKVIAMIDEGHILNIRSRDLFREVMSTSKTNRLIPGGILKGLGGNDNDIDYNLLIKGYRVYNKTGDIGISYSDAALIILPDNSRAIAGFIVEGPFNDPRSPELIRDMAASMAKVLQSKQIN